MFPRICQLSVTISALAFSTSAARSADIDFKRDIAPILENRCWGCHGEDEQESGLRLDRRAFMLKGGDSGLAAIVPGKLDKSYLIEVVRHLDPDVKMPPDEDPLPPKQIELLANWVREGAVWPGQMQEVAQEKSDHWSFQPVKRPLVPLRTVNQSVSPIDAFLIEGQAERDLTFSIRADPRSLIRRASIVLTGLIPTPDEVEEFLAAHKKEPNTAYEKLIDRLLATPHFGERWAQH